METDAQMPRLTGLNKLHADWTEYECAAGQLKKNQKKNRLQQVLNTNSAIE